MNSKGSFDSDEAFEAFLGNLAKSPEYRAMRDKAERGPHVPEAVLTEYVADRLDDEDQMRVMEHLSLCRSCSQSVRELRRTVMPVSEERADTTPVETVSGHGLSRHFETDEGFTAFLESIAQDPETEALRKSAESGPHPSDEVLRAYSEDRADDSMVFELMEHLSLCRQCAERTRIFRQPPTAAKESQAHVSDETLAHFAQTLVVGEERSNIKAHLMECLDCRHRAEIHQMRWFSNLLTELEVQVKPEMPVPVSIAVHPLDRHPGMATAGIDLEQGLPSEQPKEGAAVSVEPIKGTFSIGETVIIRISVGREGHVAVFHIPPDTETVNLVYPRGPRDDTCVSEGGVKQIPFEAMGPAGKHTLKVVWTAGSVLDPIKMDFKDRLALAQALAEFLGSVKGLSERDLMIVSYEFIVKGA